MIEREGREPTFRKGEDKNRYIILIYGVEPCRIIPGTAGRYQK